MKIIQLKKNGTMLQKDLAYFGGKYSFLERMRLGGIGSPKVIYLDGLDYFDELNAQVENEISFVNFELMKDGFLLRLNRNQKLRYVGYQLQEILDIKLKGIPLETSSQAELRNRHLNYEGLLQINFINGEILKFNVQSIYFTKLRDFFDRKMFQDKFRTDFIS